MKRIAIIGPGFKPIPDVQGGAIEHLVTTLLDENEYIHNYYIDVYTLSDLLLNEKQYEYTKIVQVKNYQNFFAIRAMFSVVNRIFNVLHIRKVFNYMSCIFPLYVKKEYDFILVENNIELFLRLKKRFPKSKIIFHLHNDFDTVDSDYDKTEERIIILEKYADLILVASFYLEKHIKDVVNSNKIRVLENCIDKERFTITTDLDRKAKLVRTKLGINDKHFVIMFCGRFDKWKGLLEFLQAIEQMEQKDDVRLLLIGSSWFGTREEKIYSKYIGKFTEKFKEQILFKGYIQQERIHEIYAATDLVAIPSQCVEAFGMTALEAISMGKPCIASACGGLLDILDDSCARFVARGNEYVEKFSQSLNELYSDREQLKKLQEGALEKAKKFSDRKEYYKKFIEIVEGNVE